MPRYNKSTNPSCGTATTGWLASGTITRITGQTVGTSGRTTAASVTSSAGAFAPYMSAGPMAPITSGTTWTYVCWVRNSVARTVRHYGAVWNGGSFVATSGSGTDVALSANTWTEIRRTVTWPSVGSHTVATIHFDFPTSGTSGTFDVGACRWEQVSDASLAFADGDSTDWVWDGTASNSTSTQPDIPQIIATTRNVASSGTTMSLASPATAAGQQIVIFGISDFDQTTTSLGAISGFSVVAQSHTDTVMTSTATVSSWGGYMKVYTKLSVSGDVGATYTLNKGTNRSLAAWAVALDAASDFNISAFNGSGTAGTTGTAPTATTTAVGRLFRLYAAYNASGITFSVPSGTTAIPSASANTTNFEAGMLAHASDLTTGATGTAASTLSASKRWTAGTVVFSLAAGSTTPVTGSDTGTVTDSSALAASSGGTDTGTLTDSSGVSATQAGTDGAIVTDSSAVLVGYSRTDTATVTDTASLVVGPTPSDSFALADTAATTSDRTRADSGTLADSSALVGSHGRTDSGALADTASLVASTTRTDTASLAASSGLEIFSHVDFAATAGVSFDLSVVWADAGLTETVSSSFDVTAQVVWKDGTLTLDVGSEQATDLVIGQRQPGLTIVSSRQLYVPAQTRGRRFIAQDVLTKEFLHWELPIINDEITYVLNGSKTISGKLDPEHPDIADLFASGVLRSRKTWIHVEEDNQILASGILEPGGVEGFSLSIDAAGFTAYPHIVPWRGDYEGVQVDPLDVIRMIWTHIQSYANGNIGVTVDSTTSPVRIGTEAEDVDFETSDGQNVSFTAGPYKLNWWANTMCGKEIDDLAKEAPVDFLERDYWNADKTDVLHRLVLGYPRVGALRGDLKFAQDENIIKPVAIKENADLGATEVFFAGAGEGRDMVMGSYIGAPNGGVRVPVVVSDNTVTRLDRANAFAEDEYYRQQATFGIEQIVIDTHHENALLGTFAEGDDILVQATIPYKGKISMSHRITSYSVSGDGSATLKLAPSSTFRYGFRS